MIAHKKHQRNLILNLKDLNLNLKRITYNVERFNSSILNILHLRVWFQNIYINRKKKWFKHTSIRGTQNMQTKYQ